MSSYKHSRRIYSSGLSPLPPQVVPPPPCPVSFSYIQVTNTTPTRHGNCDTPGISFRPPGRYLSHICGQQHTTLFSFPRLFPPSETGRPQRWTSILTPPPFIMICPFPLPIAKRMDPFHPDPSDAPRSLFHASIFLEPTRISHPTSLSPCALKTSPLRPFRPPPHRYPFSQFSIFRFKDSPLPATSSRMGPIFFGPYVVSPVLSLQYPMFFSFFYAFAPQSVGVFFPPLPESQRTFSLTLVLPFFHSPQTPPISSH